MEEINYQQEYHRLVAKNQQLEEEADLLAVENERLKELLLSHGIDPFHPTTQTEKKKIGKENTIIEDGDGNYPAIPTLTINNASGSMNALSIAYGSLDGTNLNAIICGGVDKTLRIFDFEGAPCRQYEFSAPILAIDTHGPLISCSFMDGGHALINLSVTPSEPQIYRTHIKYVVSTGWSSNGNYVYTCSHDKTVGIFKVNRDTPNEHLDLITQMRFNETPECACFVPTEIILPQLIHSEQITPSEANSLQLDIPFLIVGLRDISYLLYICVQTLQSYRISMNEHDWDNHVSFTPLFLSLSNNGRYLAVATDKDLHIVFQTGTNTRVRLLAGGHHCDSYGKPKIAWDSSDLYLYTNSQKDHLLHVYSLASGRELTTHRSHLNRHTGQVRDIRVHPTNRKILTTSFDRSVIEWSSEGN